MNGNYEKWGVILYEYTPLIISTARQVVGDNVDIEITDIVSDVVIRCLEHYGSLKHEPSRVIHKAYIEQVSRSVSTDHLRKYYRRKELDSTEDVIVGLTDIAGSSTDEHYERNSHCNFILKSVNTSKWKEIFQMFYEEGMSRKEIALSLDISQDKAERLVNKMKQYINEELKDE